MSFTRTSATTLLHSLQHGLSKHPIELVYVPHSLWPVHKARPTRSQLRVLVLDASFNPPTLAHLALANSRPPPLQRSEPKDTTSEDHDYDAKLLLLSVRNVDKALKPGDASYLQRLEMLKIFVQDVTGGDKTHPANVAIAIIDEPTFVGKSRVLQSFFKSRFAEHPNYETQLSFILGFDTLERLIQPRYYGSQEKMVESLRRFLSPEGDNSRVVCARRTSSLSPSTTDVDLSIVDEFISSGRITIIDIDDDVKGYSSSEVRNTIRRLGLEATEWRRFVPQGIASYIIREGLYGINL